MNGRTVLGTLGCLVGVGAILGLGAGCSGTAGGDVRQAQDEKLAAASAALIQGNPTAPYAFPALVVSGKNDCSSVAPTQLLGSAGAGSAAWNYGENYVAMPVTDSSDAYHTAYSHYYAYEEKGLNAQLASDFFGIPNGNGYKYLVAKLTYNAAYKTIVQSANFWYLEGIGRADTGWLMYPPSASSAKPPWCMVGGCIAGTAFFDPNSHPPDTGGMNGAGGSDWAQLWNLAWTYSYGIPQDGKTWGPYNPPASPDSSHIESTHHQCSFVYACPGGTQTCSQNSDCPSGQTCQADVGDSGMKCWASCYNPHTGTLDNNPRALVPIDFFVAAEGHDPGGPYW